MPVPAQGGEARATLHAQEATPTAAAQAQAATAAQVQAQAQAQAQQAQTQTQASFPVLVPSTGTTPP